MAIRSMTGSAGYDRARRGRRAATRTNEHQQGRQWRSASAGHRNNTVPKGKHLIELISLGHHSKEQIVDACRLWLKLQAEMNKD
jgi:hypothetical protein